MLTDLRETGCEIMNCFKVGV